MNLLGKAMDKGFWREVRERDSYAFFREETEKIWREHGEREIMALKYSDYKLFFVTGDRKIYENTYFTRRLALDSAAIMSLIYPEEERYLDKLMDIIYAICDEYTWCLPAHQRQNDRNDNSRIDLMAAETGYALAEIYTLLSDRLDVLILRRIEAEIERRIFSSFEAENPYKNWEYVKNNWSAVCEGSVACTYMLMAEDRARTMIDRFEKSMEYYLSGLEDDGVCIEGCEYWRYGFGFFTVYADMIKTFTSGRIDHFKSDKVRRVATFEQKMFLTGRACVSFSDSSPSMSYMLGLNHYLKDKYPDDVLVFDISNAYVNDHCGRFCLYLRSASWFNEEYFKNPDKNAVVSEYYLTNSEWLVFKNESYSFAAKAGNNAEFHNHNDVGAFIFAKNGTQVITDPGSGPYTRQYFDGEHRYETFEATSFAHSVPIIDGEGQKHGAQFNAKGASYKNGVFSFDMSAAYGNSELRGLKRSFVLSDGFATLTDEFDYIGEGDIIERIVTLREPQLLSNRIVIGDSEIYDFCTEDCAVSYRDTRHNKLYFVDFKLSKGAQKFECKIK
ncbi:MAG: heparinase II/III family protein [Clostridia bacterium]|nr:heparinase II/III family protein [Clostridia bacterium]